MSTTRAVLNVYDRNPVADPAVVLVGLNSTTTDEVAFHAPWTLTETSVVGSSTIATFEGTAQPIPEDVLEQYGDQLEAYGDDLGDLLGPEARTLVEDLGWKVDGVYVEVTS